MHKANVVKNVSYQLAETDKCIPKKLQENANEREVFETFYKIE